MPTCSKCGQENPSVARFCLACGSSLAVEPLARREERKVVTVLFCDLVGFTSRAERLDPEDVRAMLTPYFQRLRTELERYGGTVEKFIGDAVMALFGAPVAHEDDPERAVRAALAVRESVAELNDEDPTLELELRIGITTGEALVTLDAGPNHGEGIAAGDVVNTAARLQTVAPVNGILVDETTYRATERAIVYGAAESLVVKGKDEPVTVWEVTEARARFGIDTGRRARTPLLGRERELDALADALARARRERAPQLVTLVGVPGIGKSRLVGELFALVEADAELIAWRQGRSLPYGEGVSFWALAEIVKGEAGILESDDADAAEGKLARGVEALVREDADRTWVLSHLRPLVGLGEGRDGATDRQSEAFAAWRRFVEALGERGPTVLVFEDLHWADEGLLDFVDHLAEWVTGVPLVLVCTARPELLARRSGWGGGKANAVTLSLGPLSGDDTARLVAALLEQAVLPAAVQQALLVRAEGNPLYAEEYVRMLQDRGLLRRDGGGWAFADVGDLPLPETIQGLIAARLDTLDSDGKRLLQDAAVIGKVFWLGALAALGDASRWELEEQLHTLERRELVRREHRSAVADERQYAYWHGLVRDVAYGQIPRAARAAKHRLAAEWIESVSPTRAEDRSEMLAYHYEAALEYARATGQDTAYLAPRAARAFRDAGDRAAALNAFAAARRYQLAALELMPENDPERLDVELSAGRAMYWAEERGWDELERLADKLAAAGRPDAAAEAETLAADLVWRRGHRDGALEILERALARTAQAPPSYGKAYALSGASRLNMLAGRTDEAVRTGEEALAMADELGLGHVRVHALINVGTARANVGDRRGFDELDEAIRLGRALGSPEAVRGYINLASITWAYGELERSRQAGDDGWAFAQQLALRGPLRWLTGERSGFAYLFGRWDDALREADRFIAEAEAGTPHYLESQNRCIRVLIGIARGDTVGALTDAERSIAQAREQKDPQVLYPAFSVLTLAQLAAGSAAAARATADELIADLTGRSADLPFAEGAAVVDAFDRLDLGGALVDAGRSSGVRTPWLEAAEHLVAHEYERAAEQYADIGSRPDTAFAELRAARELTRTGRKSDADAYLGRALAFFASVGASGYVREAEELLAEAS
ncbi:MAG: AAA family ATPase [Thermoleophilia bacterium]|nr:AAA family ATPase [Thermoleophilia bacterium]